MTNTKLLNEYVLIVDDDKMITDIFVELLESLGFKCLVANDADKVFPLIRDNKIFHILLDYHLPTMDGNQLAKKIREQNPFAKTTMITGAGDKEIIVEAMRSGITDFIEKPFELDAISGIIQKSAALRREEIAREMRELEDLRSIFVEEASSIIVELDPLIEAMISGCTSPEEINAIYRKVHTLKGSAGTIPSAGPLVQLAHAFETVLTGIKEGSLSVSEDAHIQMMTAVDLLGTCVKCLEQAEELPDTSTLTDYFNKYAKGENRPVAQTVLGKSDSNVIVPNNKKPAEASDEGLFVSNEKLETLKELAGELVAFKNSFDGFIKQNSGVLGTALRELMEMDRILFKISDQIQNEISEIQKVTLAKTFVKFPRVIRQIANELGKQIKLRIEGEEMTVDRQVSRALSDALVHAVRNSCDHGIERPEARIAAGKSAQGTITIEGQQTADVITVKVIDDGNGLHRDRILKRAVERGLVSADEAKTMPDSKVWALLFEPNFSTAAQVSNISGRGVGMDVVKSVAEKYGGQAWFDTVPGQSTALTIQFPVPRTLVVEQSVVAKSDDLLLAIPLSSIAEIRTVKSNEMGYLSPFWTFQHRGVTIPMGRYQKFCHSGSTSSATSRQEGRPTSDVLVAIVNYRGQYAGIEVDSIIDQIEAVIRPFDDTIGKLPGFKGVSRLPNEDIAYVISAEDIIRTTYIQDEHAKIAEAIWPCLSMKMILKKFSGKNFCTMIPNI